MKRWWESRWKKSIKGEDRSGDEVVEAEEAEREEKREEEEEEEEVVVVVVGMAMSLLDKVVLAHLLRRRPASQTETESAGNGLVLALSYSLQLLCLLPLLLLQHLL